MVKYKTRVFYEKDIGAAGADIIIYEDNGDVIDTLLITTESTYNDLVSQIQNIDQKFVDRNELINVIQNTGSEILEINATLLNGHNEDYFAKSDHEHDTVYASKNHVNSLGNVSNAGHVKLINGLSRSVYVDGEALAAYQGYLLKDQIDKAINARSSWTTIKTGTYSSIRVNSAVRLVQFKYYHQGDLGNTLSGIISSDYAKIPSSYCPKETVMIPCHNPALMIYVSSDGSLHYSNSGSAGKKTLNGSGMWMY